MNPSQGPERKQSSFNLDLTGQGDRRASGLGVLMRGFMCNKVSCLGSCRRLGTRPGLAKPPNSPQAVMVNVL